MGSRLLAVALALLAATAGARKRRRNRAPEAPAATLSECAACEHYAQDLSLLVRAAVRRRIEAAPPAPPPEGSPEPTWAARLERSCRAPRLPFCGTRWRDRLASLVRELESLAADADDGADSSVSAVNVAAAACAHDGPLRACPKRHRWKARSAPDAVDVAFYNHLPEPVEVYWLKPGAGGADAGAPANVRRGTLAPQGTLREDSYEGHVYRVVTRGGDWASGVDVPVGGGPFHAHAIRPSTTAAFAVSHVLVDAAREL